MDYPHDPTARVGDRFLRSHAALRLLPIAVSCMFVGCGSGSPSQSEGLFAINGTELFVKRLGKGEPIVVLHGGPVLEHGYLVEHLAPLAREHELIFFDQRLCGRSAGVVPAESVRLGTFVDDIEALRVTLGLDRIHLLGHSWGGLLAMRYAIRYGENLRSLILLDSISASSELWHEEERAFVERMTDEHKQEAEAIQGTEAFARREPAAIRDALLHSFRPQFHDPRLVGKLKLMIPEDYMNRSAQFGSVMVDLKEYDLHLELEQVTTPTLLLFGESEPSTTIGGAALARHLPNSTLIVVANAGHFPFVEQPVETLGEIETFLAAMGD